jgi:ABC-type uncharacterized transport system substrate-binding protein
MIRREFIALLGGAAATWPLAAQAQQPERMRLVGVLMGSDDNAEARSRITAFLQNLQDLGWSEGRTVQIDLRWGGHSPEGIAAHARELVQLKPDVIFVSPTNALIPLQKETRTIPIVFATGARNLVTCQCSGQRNSASPSISRRRRSSALNYLQAWSPPPTR